MLRQDVIPHGLLGDRSGAGTRRSANWGDIPRRLIASGIRKPEPLFYRLVLAAAEAPPDQVLFVSDNLDYDVAAPIAHGMRAALVRPHGLRPGEELPDGALLIRHVQDLPVLLEAV